jgi:hypothetical protein
MAYVNEFIKWLRTLKEDTTTTERDSWRLLENYAAKILGSAQTGKANFERKLLAAGRAAQKAGTQQEPNRGRQEQKRGERSKLRKEHEPVPQMIVRQRDSNPQLRHSPHLEPRKDKSSKPRHHHVLQQPAPNKHSPPQQHISQKQPLRKRDSSPSQLQSLFLPLLRKIASNPQPKSYRLDREESPPKSPKPKTEVLSGKKDERIVTQQLSHRPSQLPLKDVIDKREMVDQIAMIAHIEAKRLASEVRKYPTILGEDESL